MQVPQTLKELRLVDLQEAHALVLYHIRKYREENTEYDIDHREVPKNVTVDETTQAFYQRLVDKENMGRDSSPLDILLIPLFLKPQGFDGRK